VSEHEVKQRIVTVVNVLVVTALEYRHIIAKEKFG